VRAVVTVDTPFSPDHVTGLLGPARQQIEDDEVADVVAAEHRLSTATWDDLRRVVGGVSGEGELVGHAYGALFGDWEAALTHGVA
jgi:hypothetical protein